MALTRIKTNQITDLAVTTAKLAANSVTSAKLENNLTYGSDFTVTGNLTVSGTTTSVSTTNTRVEDAIIALSAEATGSASVDSGLLINRGADDNQAMIWDESEDQFIFANVGAEDGDTAGNVSISSYAPVQMGALTATTINTSSTITGNVTGALTGNADTATALATARAIALAGDVVGTVNFDGTGDVSITTAIQANSVALGTDTTGDYTATITGGNGIASSGATSGEGIAHSLSVDLTDTAIFASDGTASRAVVLDGSGDFTANMITSDLTGDVTGTADVATSITATANDATNESVFITFVDGQTGAQGIETDIGLVYNPSTGALTSTSFVGALTGTADDADALSSAVTVQLTGDVTGSATFTSAGDTASISTTIAANSVALGTDTTGNYVGTITGGNGIASSGATTGEGIAHSLSVDLTDTNIFASDGTASRAVVLDGSGDFSAGTITAAIDGILGGNTPAAATVTSLTASGTTNLNGAVNIGNAGGDTITVAGTTTFTPSVDFDGGFTVAASQTISMGANAITNVADPSSAQDAATKAYVDSEVSGGSTLAIAGDSGTDNVIVGTNTFTFSGTANEVTTAVTDNTVTFGLASDVTVSNDLTVAGNLTVAGTTTTLSTTNSVVSDALIELNSGAASNANDLGFVFERGSTGDNAVFAWDESVDKFTLGTTTATGASTGDLTITSGTLVAALEGNADTATALETARNIAIAGDVVGTASFDGTGDISITATIQANSVALGTDTTGNYVQSIADAGNGAITVVNGTAEGGAVTLDIAANAVALGTQTTGNYVATIAGGAGIASTGAATGETIAHSLSVDLTDTSVFNSDGTVSTAVVLDGSGDFTANMITSDLTGDVTGTADVATSITAVANNSTNESVFLTFVDGATGTQGIETDTGLTYNPSTGVITSTTFSGALSGNATTATALATTRAIEVSGAVTGTANFDGSAAINIVTTATADPTITLAGDLSGSVTLTNLGNGTLTATIAANSVALGTDTTGNYQVDTSGGNGITVTHTPAEGSTATVAVDLTDTAIFASDGTASRAVVLDGSGDFTANAITTTNIDGILGANTAAAATVTTLSASGLAQLDGGMDVDGAFVVANTTGNISTTGTAIIGSATATSDVTLKVDATDSMMVPVGTTGQRPGTGVTGMLRFNSTSGAMEYYGASSWASISPDFTVATSQTFSGDDSTTAFTLSSLVGADSYTVAGVLVMLNGVVQEPTTVYGISGTTLTFTTAPATGDLIEVRKFTTSTTVVAISDLDGDTQIQVEETSDDDTIRFDVQGVEKAYLNSTGLQVAGNIHATGTISADGDITLGDASTDSVTFTAKVGSNIIPTADSTYDLGSNTERWTNIYADKLNNQFTIPTSDGTSGQALVTDGAGVLSFGPAGAVISSDTSTNTDFLLYFASTTSGALTAVKQDSGLIYNPSTGTMTASTFSGALSGNATTASTWATARDLTLTGAVTGTASIDGSGNVSLATTATADPTLTLAGDLSGSATFTNLGNATLTATIAANSVALGTDTTGNYVGAGAVSGTGLSGSLSAEGGTFTVTSNATSSNTGGTIVARDGSGNFSAGVITGTSTAARYADLAEMYAADEAIESGTVVMFGGEGKVAACDIANCRAVAGIISTDPAHLMNSAQEGVALALAGRVPCKVTGPVAAGDLMVSAGNGMAMANNEAAMGTVIGKAIEANEGGEGVIEVLALMM